MGFCHSTFQAAVRLSPALTHLLQRNEGWPQLPFQQGQGVPSRRPARSPGRVPFPGFWDRGVKPGSSFRGRWESHKWISPHLPFPTCRRAPRVGPFS